MNTILMQVVKLVVSTGLLVLENLKLFRTRYVLPGSDGPAVQTHSVSTGMMQNLYASLGVVSFLIPLTVVLAGVFAVINMTDLAGKKTALIGNILFAAAVVLSALGFLLAGTVYRRY